MSDTRTTAPVPFPWYSLVLLAFGVVAALTGTLTALNRAGLPAFDQPRRLVAAHGALMVFGFLGTAIGMERGVAYRSGSARDPRWGFLAPLFGSLGVLSLFLLGLCHPLPAWWQAVPGTFWALSMAALVSVYLGIWHRQNLPTLLLQMLGAATGAVSMVLWACGRDATSLAPSWMVFLVLTIIGERLELSRVSFTGRHVAPVLLCAAPVAVAGSFAVLADRRAGLAVLGAAFLVMLVLMAHDDIARHTWRRPGFTGFMGTAMLAAYFWGILGSLLWLVLPAMGPHTIWQTFALDCFDLGFVMSMVIAHAFLIIPAILRRPAPWPRAMWAPLVLLQSGLLVGLASAVLSSTDLNKTASALEVLALLGLVATVAGTYIARGIRSARQDTEPQNPQD